MDAWHHGRLQSGSPRGTFDACARVRKTLTRPFKQRSFLLIAIWPSSIFQVEIKGNSAANAQLHRQDKGPQVTLEGFAATGCLQNGEKHSRPRFARSHDRTIAQDVATASPVPSRDDLGSRLHIVTDVLRDIGDCEHLMLVAEPSTGPPSRWENLKRSPIVSEAVGQRQGIEKTPQLRIGGSGQRAGFKSELCLGGQR
jgi:hypothetical protein